MKRLILLGIVALSAGGVLSGFVPSADRFNSPIDLTKIIEPVYATPFLCFSAAPASNSPKNLKRVCLRPELIDKINIIEISINDNTGLVAVLIGEDIRQAVAIDKTVERLIHMMAPKGR